MFKRLMNLPLTVASRAARAYQAREDARAQSVYGAAVDPGDVGIAGSPLRTTLDIDLAAISVEAGTVREWLGGRRPVELVDVRTDAERAADPGITGALPMPMDTIQVRVSELAHDRPVVAYCADGERAAMAVRFFRERGMEDTWVMKGGLVAWRQAGGTTDAS